MDFRSYAASETTTVFDKVLARQSTLALEQLRAVRDAVEAAARALESSPGDRPAVEELVDRLNDAAQGDARRIQTEARAAIDAAHAEIAAHRQEIETLRSQVVQAETEAAVLRREIEATSERTRATERDLNAVIEAHQHLEAACRNLEAEAGDRAKAREEAEVQLADARHVVGQLLSEIDELKTGLQQRQQERDRLASELTAAGERIQGLESALAGAQAAQKALQNTADASGHLESLQGDVDRMLALFDASARAVGEMAAAASSNELLSELVKRLSLQFTRVALFRLKGNRLEGEQQVGFEDNADLTKLVIPTGVDSMLTRAVATGSVQILTGDEVAARSGTPFGGNPGLAVALPIFVQGAALGVVYADDVDVPESARTPAVHESSVGYARLLVGQVVVLLVRHTHELKMLAELSQYAATLLQEAREMYAADTEAGKSPDLIRGRLKDNVECASQLYAYRAAMEGTAAATLLDQQIAAELQESTPFARDLAIVVAGMASAPVQLTAEAS